MHNIGTPRENGNFSRWPFRYSDCVNYSGLTDSGLNSCKCLSKGLRDFEVKYYLSTTTCNYSSSILDTEKKLKSYTS